jgi:hypothetical protein
MNFITLPSFSSSSLRSSMKSRNSWIPASGFHNDKFQSAGMTWWTLEPPSSRLPILEEEIAMDVPLRGSGAVERLNLPFSLDFNMLRYTAGLHPCRRTVLEHCRFVKRELSYRYSVNTSSRKWREVTHREPEDRIPRLNRRQKHSTGQAGDRRRH